MLERDSVSTASVADRSARWAGLLIGVLAARAVGHGLRHVGEDGGVVYAISVFGLCVVAGVLAGDALTPRPRGEIRTAGLAPRRVRDHVPPRMTVLLLAQAGALVVLMLVVTVLAWSGGVGRMGGPLTPACADSWSGASYGLPVLGCVAVSTAACLWSLTRVVRRPGGDQARRDRSLAIVAAWGLLVSALLLGVASTASGDLMSTTCDGMAGRIANWVLWPTALVALVAVSWCLFTVISPRARVRR